MQAKPQKTIQRIAWIAQGFTPYSESSPNSVADCLNQYVQGLRKLKVHSTLILPPGSKSIHHHIEVKGDLQPSILIESQANSTHSALQNMLDWAWDHQNQFDLIVNLGHDYLPHAMVGKFTTPYISLPNMGKAAPSLDQLIQLRARQFPNHIWFFSKAQRSYLGIEANPLVCQGFDAEQFPAARPAKVDAPFVWAGRITPEKGLDTALSIAQKTGRKLVVAGEMGNAHYFEHLRKQYPTSSVKWEYVGALPRQDLYNLFSTSFACLQTQDPNAIEAFGRVTAESMLCGCPVLYTDCGANSEVVLSVGGGFLLRPEQLDATLDQLSVLARTQLQTKAKAVFGQVSVARNFLAQAQQLFYPQTHYFFSSLAKEVAAKTEDFSLTTN